ncbi:MAG: DUF3552 domain-containing protein, partial [Chloroflexi bacterium]|nr:DUF3552 domain-containing protein [Chloroflexota bacterium]
MTTTIIVVLAVLAVTGIGAAAWLLLRSKVDGTRIQSASARAASIINQAEEEQRKLHLAAQEEVLQLRTAGENEVKEQRQEVNRMERRHLQREEQLEHKVENLEIQQKELGVKEAGVQEALLEVEAAKSQQLQKLEEIASLNVEDARQMVLKRGEEEAQHGLSRRHYELEKEFKARADENARRIIVLA